MEFLEKGKHFGERKDQLVINGLILCKAKVDAITHVPWHCHENAYFLFNLKGHLNEVSKKGVQPIAPGNLLFHHSQEAHYNKDISEDTEFFHVELSQEWFKKYDISLSLIEGQADMTNTALKTIFKTLYHEMQIKDKATHIAAESLMLQAFSHIIRRSGHGKPDRPEWTNKITEIIHDEEWENLSLDHLAKELQLHPAYLSRKFSEYFNINLATFIREKKLERAVQLLTDRFLKNSEIAYLCGFSDESHFVKLFKSKYNLTPSQYRKIISGG